MAHLPDYCITQINAINCFTVDLPVTAFGYRDDTIMQLNVEYGKSADGTQYNANVWASRKRSLSRHFIYPMTIAVCDNPNEAIFQALNEDDAFYDAMCDYIEEAAKHRVD